MGTRIVVISDTHNRHSDIKLPEGFGLPYYTDEGFSLTTQVLNLNARKTKVRHKVSLNYVTQKGSAAPMQPLFQKGVYGLKLIDL